MAAYSSPAAFISIESSPAPPSTHPRNRADVNDNNKAVAAPSPAHVESGRLNRNARPTGQETSDAINQDRNSHDATDETAEAFEAFEMNAPASGAVIPMKESMIHPFKNRYRFASSCFMNFQNGMNDGVSGALIPYMEKHYGIGYAVVSLIFVTTAVGFIVAAPLTHMLEARLGRARVYILAMAMMTAAYVAISCTPPFAVVVIAYFFLGVGIAMNLALNNVFCSNLANATAALGINHGGYGLGATVAPLMATTIVNHGGLFSRFYLITLGMSVFNLIFSGWSFWDYEDERGRSRQPTETSAETSAEASTAGRASAAAQQQPQPSKSQVLKTALSQRTTLLGALFIFAYQGAEVANSGWVISYLIHYRSGTPSKVGYVTSGFWGGITVGRFVLSHPAQKLGKKASVVGLTAGSLVFQLLVWLVPNVVGDAVAVAILGLLLGPVYPCAMAIFTALLPRPLQISSLSFVSAMGSSGGAVAPLATGLAAQKVGTVVLHPICIALFVVMEVAWLCLPRLRKAVD
ncbi:MAG: hypothetical protein M1819_000792 [Sarea resinae]|nr:MAG: hypothetical protein M1819_000792 [Sarea resinae]